MAGEESGIDAFLSQPLTARIATNGPTVRPTWFLWEDQAFWILTGPWARLPRLVQADPAIALVVDECNLATGLVRQVIARGRAEVLPFDVPRGRRKLTRYLGPTRPDGISASSAIYLMISWKRARPGFACARTS